MKLKVGGGLILLFRIQCQVLCLRKVSKEMDAK